MSFLNQVSSQEEVVFDLEDSDLRRQEGTPLYRETSLASHDTADDEDEKDKEDPFPLKLHKLLELLETEGKQHIIGWNPDAKSFSVFKPKQFAEKIMPDHFQRQSKYKSFQRQLNLYGFKRESVGQIKGIYSHPLFIRDNRDMCKEMRRERQVKKSRKQRSESSISTGSVTSPRKYTRKRSDDSLSGEESSTSPMRESGDASLPVPPQTALSAYLFSLEQGSSGPGKDLCFAEGRIQPPTVAALSASRPRQAGMPDNVGTSWQLMSQSSPSEIPPFLPSYQQQPGTANTSQGEAEDDDASIGTIDGLENLFSQQQFPR